jgi:hypothetical protein
MKDHPCRKFRYFVPFIVLGFLAVFTFAVFMLWNHVLVEVLAVKTITYWQALGLLVLAKIFFGGFPGRCRQFGPGGGWRGAMMAKHWESLSPEQREHMRDEMRRKFGDWPHPPWCGPEPESGKIEDGGKPTT